MTRYELYRRAARALAGASADALYDYILHGMDDRVDFLRTRHERWDEPLPDGLLRTPPRWSWPRWKVRSTLPGIPGITTTGATRSWRMQLFFFCEGEDFLPDAAWATEGGYNHVFIRQL